MVALGDVIAHHVRPPNASSSCSSAVASSAGSSDEVRVAFFSLSCLFLRLHVLILMGERGRLPVQHHHHHHHQRTAHLISRPGFLLLLPASKSLHCLSCAAADQSRRSKRVFGSSQSASLAVATHSPPQPEKPPPITLRWAGSSKKKISLVSRHSWDRDVTRRCVNTNPN